MDCIEGKLTLRLDDGREFTELVVSAEHAAAVVARWERGDCGGRYQAASSDHHWCARPAGHAGHCGHRRTREDEEGG